MRGLLAPFPDCLLTPSPPTNSLFSPLTLLGAERGRDQKETLQGISKDFIGGRGSGGGGDVDMPRLWSRNDQKRRKFTPSGKM